MRLSWDEAMLLGAAREAARAFTRFNENLSTILLGPGDLLRPHDHDGDDATLPLAGRLEPLSARRRPACIDDDRGTAYLADRSQ